MEDSRNIQSPYAASFLEQVATEFCIPKEFIPSLAKASDDAARWYFVVQKTPTKTEQERRSREQLEHLREAVSFLIEGIKGLSAVSRERAWHPVWHDPKMLPILVGLVDPFGPGTYNDENQLLALLEKLGRRMDTVLTYLPVLPNKGGCPENEALRAFVGLLSGFWERVLGRRFSYSVAGRHKRGSAFEFCLRLVQAIAPDVTVQELSTAMRAIIETKPVTINVDRSLFSDEIPDSEIRASFEAMTTTVVVEGREPPA